MAQRAASTAESAEVRLAELVAALSLGVDLGFGQPMEHVLRQCVISLRLAELLRMDDRDRSVVYYSALLVNVGCHSDAHEQAKWFGDDIALKSTKYTYDPDKAKALLQKAGFAKGFSTTLSYNAGVPEQEEISTIYQTSLGKIGVKLTLNKLPAGTFYDYVTKRGQPMI